MCRKLALAATALMLAAGPALAADAPSSAAPAPAPAAASAPSSAAPAQPRPTRRKATAQQRAQADRLPGLDRVAFWSEELQISPDDQEAAVRYAVALRAIRNYREAARIVEQVLVINPDNRDALLEKARAYIGIGQGFYAIEPARKAQAMQPNDWRPFSLLGVAYQQTERFAEADAAFAEALRLSPENPAVLNNLAMLRADRGQTAEAEALLRRAAARPDAPKQARINLTLVLGMEGKLVEAEQMLREELPPDQVARNLQYLRAVQPEPETGGRTSWQGLRDGAG